MNPSESDDFFEKQDTSTPEEGHYETRDGELRFFPAWTTRYGSATEVNLGAHTNHGTNNNDEVSEVRSTIDVDVEAHINNRADNDDTTRAEDTIYVDTSTLDEVAVRADDGSEASRSLHLRQGSSAYFQSQQSRPWGGKFRPSTMEVPAPLPGHPQTRSRTLRDHDNPASESRHGSGTPKLVPCETRSETRQASNNLSAQPMTTGTPKLVHCGTRSKARLAQSIPSMTGQTNAPKAQLTQQGKKRKATDQPMDMPTATQRVTRSTARRHPKKKGSAKNCEKCGNAMPNSRSFWHKQCMACDPMDLVRQD